MNAMTPVSTLASYNYSLGASGDRTAVTERSGRTVNYAYDGLYRLTSEAVANDSHGVNGSVSYGYDAVGKPIAVFAGHEAATNAALESGAQGYLVKPIDSDELLWRTIVAH
jgi:YD repeat-containing protein